MHERVWYWLSFVDPEKPEGERFLGVSIVEISDDDPIPSFGLSIEEMAEKGKVAWHFFQAVGKTHRLGINPGGEVRGELLDRAPDPAFVGRLLNKAEALAARNYL